MIMGVQTACRMIAHAGLVIGSQGNASARHLDQMLIKPSGVICSSMTGRSALANVSIATGERLTASVKPSTDAEAHRWVYNALPEINGIVHTHSPWASMWATAGKAIPCCTTGQSDVFGGDIPCSQYCPIGGDDIGKEIVRLHEYDNRRRTFLIRQHGVFAIGVTLAEAVQAAIFAEHFAHVTWGAEKLGGLKLIPADEMKANYERYHSDYGQPRNHSKPNPEPPGVGDR